MDFEFDWDLVGGWKERVVRRGEEIVLRCRCDAKPGADSECGREANFAAAG